MRKIISLVLCLTVIFSYTIQTVYANAYENYSLDNVVSTGNFAVYSYENSSLLFNIFINTNTSIGSFAVKYSSSPSCVQEYNFTLESSSIDITSSDFWNNLISDCFAASSEWQAIYFPSYITVVEQADSNNMSRSLDSTTEYFYDWLEQEYGSEHSDTYLSSAIKNNITFVQHETLEYDVLKHNAYKVLQAISVAGFITSVIGAIVSPGLLSAIGLIASATGFISAGTTIYEYTLSAYWCRYVTVRYGAIKYSFAERRIQYSGYESDKTGSCAVDAESLWGYYTPSQELFESADAQFTEALSNYEAG